MEGQYCHGLPDMAIQHTITHFLTISLVLCSERSSSPDLPLNVSNHHPTEHAPESAGKRYDLIRRAPEDRVTFKMIPRSMATIKAGAAAKRAEQDERTKTKEDLAREKERKRAELVRRLAELDDERAAEEEAEALSFARGEKAAGEDDGEEVEEVEGGDGEEREANASDQDDRMDVDVYDVSASSHVVLICSHPLGFFHGPLLLVLAVVFSQSLDHQQNAQLQAPKVCNKILAAYLSCWEKPSDLHSREQENRRKEPKTTSNRSKTSTPPRMSSPKDLSWSVTSFHSLPNIELIIRCFN